MIDDLTPEQKEHVAFIMEECELRSIEGLEIKDGCKECSKLELCKSLYKDFKLTKDFVVPKAIMEEDEE